MSLDITGAYAPPLSRTAIWNGLDDPVILRQCIPGCETLEKNSETEFAVVSRLALIGQMATRSWVRARAALPVLPKANAVVCLVEAAEGTQLTYSAQAQVGGELAQLGQRLIAGLAKKDCRLILFQFCRGPLVYRGTARGGRCGAKLMRT